MLGNNMHTGLHVKNLAMSFAWGAAIVLAIPQVHLHGKVHVGAQENLYVLKSEESVHHRVDKSYEQGTKSVLTT